MDYAGKWSYDVRCHTCITLRARVAELEAQLATAERRGVERALRWAWLELADEYAAPFEEKAVSAGLAALFPEANRE